jgi:hypothetical protein
MKKIVLLSMLIFCCFFGYAQKRSYVYCELVGSGKFLSTKVTVQADFGQKSSFFGGVDSLKDADGFNSMIDAMNFKGTQVWEFVQAYIITTDNRNISHWLLKKEINQEETKQLEEDFKSL